MVPKDAAGDPPNLPVVHGHMLPPVTRYGSADIATAAIECLLLLRLPYAFHRYKSSTPAVARYATLTMTQRARSHTQPEKPVPIETCTTPEPTRCFMLDIAGK